MGNLFDQLQDTAFSTVTNTMGYQASWTPSAGGAAKTATVLYNGPTEKEKLLSANFDPDKLTMEYKLGDFDGLKECSDDNIFETVVITGIGSFKIQSVRKKFDGKTFEATLKEI